MGRLEMFMDDLALQRKKLDDMREWKSVDVLMRAQTAAVERLEKRIEEIRIGEKPVGKLDLEIEAVVESH